MDFKPNEGKPHRGLTLSDLARVFSLELIGEDAEVLYQGSLSFSAGSRYRNVLTYLISEKYIPEFEEKGFDFAVIPESMKCEQLPENRSYLVTKSSPLETFIKIHLYVVEHGLYYKVTSDMGSNCKVSKRAVVYENVHIGDRCEIEDYVVIYPNTIIGDEVRIQANTVIGGDGFEVKTVDGRRRVIPHCGGIFFEDNVEIGSSCTIDRSMRHIFTYIGFETKVSNQVQLAHGAYIGRNCTIAGHAQIANVRLGDSVKIAAGVCCRPQITIGNHVFAGIGSVIIKSVPAHELVVGNPARRIGWVCKCGSRIDFGPSNEAICEACGLNYVRDGKNVYCLKP